MGEELRSNLSSLESKERELQEEQQRLRQREEKLAAAEEECRAKLTQAHAVQASLDEERKRKDRGFGGLNNRVFSLLSDPSFLFLNPMTSR